MLITNVRKDNWLQELHESNLTKDFLSWSIDKTEKCQDCKLKYLCGGGCRAVSYNVYGSIYAYNECMCSYLKDDTYQRINKIVECYL